MTLDIAARLASARPSVANTQAYVTACHAVGYQHPDLTAHAGQIVEWFACEDGLDLAVLDADCAALRTAAGAADEAVRVSRDGLAALTAAWDGESSSRAIEFVDRHCAAGVVVAAALRTAAEACEVLRDELARRVDEKVGAAVSIDDRRAGERPTWLAAAATVTGGGAEREEAVEVVTRQITPYVDADIRGDWLTAMRSATSAVSAAYEDALRQLNSSPTVHFEVPGPLGAPPPFSPVPLAQTVPAAAAVPAPSPTRAPVAPPPIAEPEPPLPQVATNAAPAQPLPPASPVEPPPVPALDTPAATGMPALPTMPDVGGGLSGLVGQITDALSGLFDNMPDDAVDTGVPEPDDPVDEKDPEAPDPAKDDVPEHDPAVEEKPLEDVAAEEPPAPAPAEPEPGPPPPTLSPDPAPPPTPPPSPPVVEPTDEQTPCEIAADELPQVGR
ncbi:hypothetical protein H7J51_04875 [Mycobacterium crocinum]|uniref:Uncharacterized protein n=1 Tax=Mycolicibacterium crocinum TaxID=388459 RepID=A0ABY3TZJ6_9MYCO|nr:hypothetical protein [Mycolicibacterium crocinum]MCV7214617.1 hypothetical protein [Mycolicibacterium crocinum]ULN44680.1 hypothetical protein MI149_07155 [Mycolicibacterium crocinum]